MPRVDNDDTNLSTFGRRSPPRPFRGIRRVAPRLRDGSLLPRGRLCSRGFPERRRRNVDDDTGRLPAGARKGKVGERGLPRELDRDLDARLHAAHANPVHEAVAHVDVAHARRHPAPREREYDSARTRCGADAVARRAAHVENDPRAVRRGPEADRTDRQRRGRRRGGMKRAQTGREKRRQRYATE